MVELKEWLDVANSITVTGILIAILYYLRKENNDIKKQLDTERNQRTLDLKEHASKTENLLEKTLVAHRDIQTFLERYIREWKEEIKDKLTAIENKIKNEN